MIETTNCQQLVIALDLSAKNIGVSINVDSMPLQCFSFRPSAFELKAFFEKLPISEKDKHPIFLLETPKVAFGGSYAFASQKTVLGAVLLSIASNFPQSSIFTIQASQWKNFYKNFYKKSLPTKATKKDFEILAKQLFGDVITNDDIADAVLMAHCFFKKWFVNIKPTVNIFL